MLGICFGLVGLVSYSLVSGPLHGTEPQKTSLTSTAVNAFIPTDLVTVTVRDSHGNLKSQQTTHNIVTSNGAIWFCIEQNRCTAQITGSVPAVPNVAGATWWVQFISGTPNANEPTAADCTSASGGGSISGQVAGGRCVTNFGAAPAQYQAGGAVITLSLSAGAGQLRTPAGTIDAVNNYVQTTRATLCSIVNDGTAPASGTCQFSDTTPVFTNFSGGALTVSGLALNSGTASAATAGPLVIAEAAITPIVLAAGDTISVTWTVIT